MKIIDFIVRGNQVKFFVGADDCNNYWGDDWNDRPYEHNAGSVYSEFVLGWFVKTFDFDDVVLEASDGDWHGNSPYSKEDMKNRKVPCVCVLPKEYQDDYTWYTFNQAVGNEHAIKYYFGDTVDETKEDIHYVKNVNGDRKYLAIAFDVDAKLQKVVGNMLGTAVSTFVATHYGREFDDESYAKACKLTLANYKKYVENLMKLNAKFFGIEDVDKMISSLEVKFVDGKYKTIDKRPTTTICVQSPIYFEIGVTTNNMYF